MNISFGDNQFDAYPTQVYMSWSEMLAILNKLFNEEINGDDKKACKVKATGITPCWFEGGHRLMENASDAWFVWLDCENGVKGDLDKVVNMLAGSGLESVVYTTAGHSLAEDRFRVVVPLSTPLEGHDDYLRVWTKLVDWFGVAVDRGKRSMYHYLFQPAQYSSAYENKFYHLPGVILTAEQWLSRCPPTPQPAPRKTVPVDPAKIDQAYVMAVINNQLARIAQATPSTRHNTILSVAIELAGWQMAGCFDWCDVRDQIVNAGVAAVGQSREAEIIKIVDRDCWHYAVVAEVPEPSTKEKMKNVFKELRSYKKKRKNKT